MGRRVTARAKAVLNRCTCCTCQRRIERRRDAVSVSEPDDLSVEEVGLHIAGVAAQRLPGGVARSGIPSGYRAYGRSVGARRRGCLERDEFDSRMPQDVLTF